jgi:hypothetical protein
MAKFLTFGAAITTDSVSWAEYTAGIRKSPPGYSIHELLKHTEGKYEDRLPLLPRYRAELIAVVQLTGDEELLRIANAQEVVISLEHLRGLDLNTRIETGYWIEYTEAEKQQLGIAESVPADPAKTINVKMDPAKPWLIAKG